MLSELLEADEEGRGRVEAARRESEQALRQAQAARNAAAEARAQLEQREIESELRAIANEAEAQVAERRQHRERWLTERRAAAKARLDEAAATWLAIVLGGES